MKINEMKTQSQLQGKNLLKKDISNFQKQPHQRWSVKKVFLKILQNSQENMCFATLLKDSNTGVFL